MAELAARAADLSTLMALFEPGQVTDPYPAYREWRTQQPVARPHARLFGLSRFADCEAVLADGSSFGRAEPGETRLFGGRVRQPKAGSFLRMNAPDHARLRRLASLAFTPARVNALTPHIGTITWDLLHGIDSEAGGVAAGCRIVPPEWLTQVLTPHVDAESIGISPFGSVLSAYGYLWWLPRMDGDPRWSGAAVAAGNYGQYLLILPRISTVIVHRRFVSREFAVGRNNRRADVTGEKGPTGVRDADFLRLARIVVDSVV